MKARIVGNSEEKLNVDSLGTIQEKMLFASYNFKDECKYLYEISDFLFI